MSPEQAGGDEIDGRSDLFSLGSVMYFMATGREPFRAQRSLAVLNKITHQRPESPRSINSSVPKTLEAIIEKLLDKQPDKRFESASEVQEVLTQYLAYLQDPKTHKKPIVNENKINMKRGLVMGTIVLLLSAMAGWGGVKCVSYLMQPKKRKPSFNRPIYTNQNAQRQTQLDYGQPVSTQEVTPTGSFTVEMNKLKKRISAMEVRLSGRSN